MAVEVGGDGRVEAEGEADPIPLDPVGQQHPVGLQGRRPGHQQLTGPLRQVGHGGRGQAAGRGLPGRHVDPGAQGAAGVVVGADAELVLGPGPQAPHGVGEAAGGPWGVLGQEHLDQRSGKRQ